MKFRISGCLAILAILSLFIFTGCGCPSSTSSDAVSIKEQVKAEEGSTLTSDNNRITLEIPPGALFEDTLISISEVGENDWSSVIKDLEPEGEVLRLEPDGLELDEPVTITLNLDTNELSAMESGQGIIAYTLVSISEDGKQEYIDNVETRVSDDGSIAVSANISHFSWIVRQKSWVQVKLKEVKEEKAVDEIFDISIELTNMAPHSLDMNLYLSGGIETSNHIEIEGRGRTSPRIIEWESGEPHAIRQDVFVSTPRDILLMPNLPRLFSWNLKGIEPGTGAYTLYVYATEIGLINQEHDKAYRLVLADAVNIVKTSYSVSVSSGFYMQAYATQEKVAAFSWNFESKAGGVPPVTKFACIKPVQIPAGFRARYDSGEAIVERDIVDKKADNLYIPFDETGRITFSLATETPGEYTFEIYGILNEDYTDDESYEGNGDRITVKVPEPSEVGNLKREWETNPGCHRGYDDKCLTVKWYMYDDESEIVPLSELRFTFPGLTAPDGRKYPGLFLLKVEKTMVEGHPYLPYQYDETLTIYHWADRLSFCGEFGSGQTKCGYGDDGILYFTVNMRPWEIRTISILDVADGFIDYKGTGDPIMITYPNEDEDLIVTYPD